MRNSPKASRRPPDFVAATCAGLLVALVGGCSPYQITGKVIEGPNGYATTVSPADRQLSMNGLAGVKVQLTIDPRSISPKVIGEFITDGDGRFNTPVHQLGAGILEYELGVQVRGTGYLSVYQNMALPPKGRPLLIVLAPGKDRRAPPTDFLRETEQLGEQLLR